jgi:hypothetical protein
VIGSAGQERVTFHVEVELSEPVLLESEACDMPISPLSRSVVVEIDRDMLELLPERQTVVSWLGPDVDLKQTIIPKETQLPG